MNHFELPRDKPEIPIPSVGIDQISPSWFQKIDGDNNAPNTIGTHQGLFLTGPDSKLPGLGGSPPSPPSFNIDWGYSNNSTSWPRAAAAIGASTLIVGALVVLAIRLKRRATVEQPQYESLV
jgi:hypothetical protein